MAIWCITNLLPLIKFFLYCKALGIQRARAPVLNLMCPVLCQISLGFVQSQKFAEPGIRFQRRLDAVGLPLCLDGINELSELCNLGIGTDLFRTMAGQKSADAGVLVDSHD